jgi:redox-sensitive bicupin YhaK (pirin superfamily)
METNTLNTKTVQQVYAPAAPHMVGDGFRVHNFFPGGHRIGVHRMSPFFLMDYGAKTVFPPTDTPRGVGAHPHRGFETVTLAYHGRVAHHDSAGNSGVIGEGDVQWMTAGSGILHKEYHEKEFSRAGGLMQMVQLWVNLPAKHKMTAPKYQALTHADMGRFVLPDGGGRVEVIAGEFNGAKGPAYTFTPIQMYNAHLKKGASVGFAFPEAYNTGILVLEGKVSVNGGAPVPTDHFILLGNEGEAVSLRAEEDAVALVLSGEPIDEPIASYGPFVMNTQEEIMRAVEDFNSGKFGTLR